MAETLAEFEGRGETLASKVDLAEQQVGHAAEVETVSLSPGVLTVRLLRAVERIAGVLKGFVCVSDSDECFGEGEAEVDRVSSEATRVRQQDAGFRPGQGLGVISQMVLELKGRTVTAEPEFDHTGAVREILGVPKILGSLGWNICTEETSEDSVAAAEKAVIGRY
ncbi:MAG TPA: hypothetical protein VNH18_35840 [Bryobacteraceae bacterium]|nr:hypothetical protein [Bryobacteraceae bacterium]HXJ44715.1 hypothetical protein [Bryobacteraceae bacterium]